MREAIKLKADTYHREANHRGALLLPFVLTTVGGFTPRSLVHDGGGLLDPKDAFKPLFHRGKFPVRGSQALGVAPSASPSKKASSAPSPPMLLGAPTALSTTRPSPTPPALGSSLIRLSGA